MIDSGCVYCGTRTELLNLSQLCVLCQVEIERVLRAEHEEGLRILRAIGEAIATVARARLVCTLMAKQNIQWTNDDKSVGVDLDFWRGKTLETSTVTLIRYTSEHPGIGSRIAEWEGHPVDVAAEAVAAMIEQCEREESL